MTQAMLQFVHYKPIRLVDRVADLFRSQPDQWIDGRLVAQVGGAYAWRTRISDCRRELRMTIENQKRTVQTASGQTITVSEYRYRPPGLTTGG